MIVVMYEKREVFGPFHRREGPRGQDAAAVVLQVLSGELWGLVPRSGGDPRVKAFRGRLPHGQSGIEFWAFARPDAWGPRVFWRFAGPYVSVDTVRDVVKLKLAFVKITQELHA